MALVHVADFEEPPHFDPLSTEQLTRIICRQFEEQPSYSLATDLPEFDGAGLYAVYYEGATLDLYARLSGLAIPLYVGQARSHNSATGVGRRDPRPLWSRVAEHRRSISEARLSVSEFGVRLLKMPDVHIDMGEDGLRRGYQPVWNSILTGFGSHEQGPRTRRSSRSKWDTVHAGRSRTFGESSHKDTELIENVRAKIRQQIDTFADLPWHQGALRPEGGQRSAD